MHTHTRHEAQAIDPISFEVISHRLWGITQEAGLVLGLVSGSPVSQESHDCSTSLMAADGDGVIMGPGHGHAVPHSRLVKYILREYADNPGIEPDDMFICNDPYISTHHQNCVDVVAPVFHQGMLVAWAGAGIHEIDVGGPKPGQVALGAQSIYEEAPPMTPLKLVERGRVRKDIEREYLQRSRTADLNALDLRAKLAANQTMKQRIGQVIERYGVETVLGTIRAIVTHTEQRIRDRLAEFPDGTWSCTTFLDYPDCGATTLFACRLVMRKRGGGLAMDFSDSSPQAPGVINCTRPALESTLTTVLFPFLCFDLTWSPAALFNVVNVISRPGTFVDASWPAGVCKASSAAMVSARIAAHTCLAKMFATTEAYRDRANGSSKALTAVQELRGVDQRGEPFGVPLIDVSLSGGWGAWPQRDGLDAGGNYGSPYSWIANIETYESRYPILYLHRRLNPDSGGKGKQRGGTGISVLYACHDVDGIPTSITHSLGHDVPTAIGLSGGYPGSTNSCTVLRSSNLRTRFSQGQLPVDVHELSGEPEPIPALHSTSLHRDDVYWCINPGGGGYGDPLERDPVVVQQDVRTRLVSPDAATRHYAVVLWEDGRSVDLDATDALRRRMRIERAASASRASQLKPSTRNRLS